MVEKEENVFKRNEMMIMLEQMSDGISIIAEEQKSLRVGQEKLRGDMNEGFKKVDERFDSVFEFLSNIEDELVDLRKEINILKETKADDEKVIDLDKRLIAIERQVNAI
jgi:regulator of replication initiation timing